MLIQPIDYFLLVWFTLALASTLYVAWDQFANNPEPVVMKWGFILVTLYLGPFGLLIYVLADKEPRPGTHEEFVKPLWKQGIGSTIHCVAGDATGIIIAAVIVALLGLPMWLDLIIEYIAGFAVGLLIFQALFMKNMMGGTYWENVRKSFLPEFISMNFMMAGMAPVMSFLMMGRDMRAMEPTELLFWGVMSLGVMAGFALAYPSNVWMVARGLKHGLMTDRGSATQGGQAHKDHSGTEAHEHHQHAAASASATANVADEHSGHHSSSHAEAAEVGKSSHDHGREPSGIPVTAKIGRHPLHPMLVTLPIGLFVTALLSDIAYWITADAAWATASVWLVGTGLVSGVLAGIAGLTDFFGNEAIRGLYHARRHLLGNVALLAIAAISLTVRLSMEAEQAILPAGLIAAVLIVALLLYTGWHGGEMVFGHGVGMEPHQHGAAHPQSKKRKGATQQAGGSHHGQHGVSGHDMGSDVTTPQLAAVGGVSLMLSLFGMVAPANWVNMTLSARDVGGAMMPAGMLMDRDTSAEAMLDMAAIHPRDVEATYGLDTRGDQVLEPSIEDGVKVFDIETKVVRWTILPDVTVDAYTFNGQVPGPRLEIREGERVRINVKNGLPESTSVHWHGLVLPNEMDGPAEITQPPIQPGETYVYEFTAVQSGSYFYHSHDHVDRQQSLGLYGALMIEPAQEDPTTVADQEYVVLLQEWLKREGLTYPAMPMDGGQPNYFTINGRAYPETDTIKMKVGETLKVRFVGSNNGFIHPMHIHGGPFTVVARDGIDLPPSARFEADTVNVGPGQRYDVIWRALNPGKWLVHCHIGHHTTNNNTETEGGGGLMMVIDVAGYSRWARDPPEYARQQSPPSALS